MRKFLVPILLVAASSAGAQQAAPASKFIRENAPVIAVTHVHLIDGTGAAQPDQTIVLDHGKILAVGPAASIAVPAGAKVIDAKGKTVIPGIVGMHEHLFYPAANDGEPIFIEQPFSFPQLYLASGVTTARATGSIEPYTDLQVNARVDSGKLPGPDFYLTTLYLEGEPAAGARRCRRRFSGVFAGTRIGATREQRGGCISRRKGSPCGFEFSARGGRLSKILPPAGTAK